MRVVFSTALPIYIFDRIILNSLWKEDEFPDTHTPATT
ncbi:hypothetical protein HLRTI_002157 [Halorhabdus tiamatea SARL4B]|uniref:Uncharacterized protein n=1 Tax=Halorhabdus tiamatea SARL4B TaxID=1033806 RepID=U2FBH0_9EURY|nr:hypothetical protein HLRTI_002157 [Halorhabdus tiamatea SARL4B]